MIIIDFPYKTTENIILFSGLTKKQLIVCEFIK